MSARLDCGTSILRPWQDSDRASLVRFANNRNVWRNLKDRFPHPYTERDADAWLALAHDNPGRTNWAIEVDGLAVGGVAALALGELGFMRLEAPVFGWNPASMRVLEKCGFVREGVMHKSVFKDGEMIDSVLYARLAP